jgi:hypothetical protein
MLMLHRGTVECTKFALCKAEGSKDGVPFASEPMLYLHYILALVEQNEAKLKETEKSLPKAS